MYGAQVLHCQCTNEKRLWSDGTKIIHFTAGLGYAYHILLSNKHSNFRKPWDYDPSSSDEPVHPCIKDLYDIWYKKYQSAA